LAEPPAGSLTAELLGTSFEVRWDDLRWGRLLTTLWEPFVTNPSEGPGGASRQLLVVRGSPEWTAEPSWRTSISTPDVWLMANEIRYLLVERAIELAPELVVLHAAALSRDSERVILAGESGIGKTTLTLELLERGWRYLSDDIVPVSRDGAIQAFPKPIGIKDIDRWPWGSETGAEGWPPPPTDGFLLPPPRGTIDLEGGPATLLVFLSRAEEGASWQEISAGHALIRCQELVRGVGRDSLKNLGNLCRRTPAIALMSSSPDLSAHYLDNRVAR
jgi:hypothetical protein